MTAGGKPATHIWLGANQQHTLCTTTVHAYGHVYMLRVHANNRNYEKLKARKCFPEHPKWAQKSPRWPKTAAQATQDDPKMSPKRPNGK